jgi:hypothetical protein
LQNKTFMQQSYNGHLVDLPHHNKVNGGLALGRIVQAGAGNAEQSALPDNAERGMVMLDHALPAGDARRFPQALAKKIALLNSAMVFSPERANRATLALKAGA